jgi:hypothetical protein
MPLSDAAGSAAWACAGPLSASAPTRTIQQVEPPFWKKPYTACARYAPSMNGPLSGFDGSP